MTAQTIKFLGGAIAVMVVGVLLFSGEDNTTNPDRGRKVFPELMSKINDVKEIVVSANSGTATMSRDGETWVVKEKSGYPADMGKVRELLIGLGELEIIEAKTKNPELYDKLGLQDVTEEGSLSNGVTIKGEGGVTLADAVIGTRRPAKGDSSLDELYYRHPGHPQTWLAIGNLKIEPIPGEWVNKTIYEVETKRVKAVQITHPDGTIVELEKDQPDDSDYHVVNLPKKSKIQSQFTVNNMVSTLAVLRLDDVKSAKDLSSKGKKVVTAVFETFDGLEGTVKIWKDGEQHYITASTVFNPTLIWKHQPKEAKKSKAPTKADDSKTENESDEKDESVPEKPTIKPAVEVNAEVEAINKKVEGWVYAIPKFRAETILKKPKDLIQKPS